MQAPARPLYPAPALDWLVGTEPRRILDLASGSGGFAASLMGRGHEVFSLDRSEAATIPIRDRLGAGRSVVGQAESLPFVASGFDLVTASQALHHFAPGLALAEVARVLRPQGHLAVAYNTRDDTVPWVRRLVALMRAADPDAMIGDFGTESVQTLSDSPYFPDVVHRSFRNWVPITRPGLQAMVERRPSTARMEPAVRTRLLASVGELYDSVARPPEPLLLPFRAACWRAQVDRSMLAADADDGLEISLRF